jgi:hypothetical protein
VVATRELTAREFFEALPVALAPKLPIELRAFETAGGRGRLLKLHYGRPETHFEVWHHTSAGKLEVGLHFEGARDLNAHALEFFRARIVEVKAGLPRAELEPWDRGWARLYETLPAPALTDRVLTDAAQLLAGYLKTLQPLLDLFWGEN